jgi:hypothetical protein
VDWFVQRTEKQRQRQCGQAHSFETNFHEINNQQKNSHWLPRQCMSDTTTHLLKGVQSPCWPVSGLTELPSSPSQVLVQGSQWLLMKAEYKSKK